VLIDASVISSFEKPEKLEYPEQLEKPLYQQESSHIWLNLMTLGFRGEC